MVIYTRETRVPADIFIVQRHECYCDLQHWVVALRENLSTFKTRTFYRLCSCG